MKGLLTNGHLLGADCIIMQFCVVMGIVNKC